MEELKHSQFCHMQSQKTSLPWQASSWVSFLILKSELSWMFAITVLYAILCDVRPCYKGPNCISQLYYRPAVQKCWVLDPLDSLDPNMFGGHHRQSQYTPRITQTVHRAESRFAPSQWEKSLQSNDVSHWLGANLESTVSTCFVVFCYGAGII